MVTETIAVMLRKEATCLYHYAKLQTILIYSKMFLIFIIVFSFKN